MTFDEEKLGNDFLGRFDGKVWLALLAAAVIGFVLGALMI